MTIICDYSRNKIIMVLICNVLKKSYLKSNTSLETKTENESQIYRTNTYQSLGFRRFPRFSRFSGFPDYRTPCVRISGIRPDFIWTRAGKKSSFFHTFFALYFVFPLLFRNPRSFSFMGIIGVVSKDGSKKKMEIKVKKDVCIRIYLRAERTCVLNVIK